MSAPPDLGRGEHPRATPLRLADLAQRAAGLTRPGGRAILGICGPPGAGKTTLTQHLVGALGPERAAHVGMDGYHLAQAALRRLGRLERKGAIDTFDADGYAAMLARLAAARPRDRPVYVPVFDRDLEEPVAAGAAVAAHVPLVITEGNYLLSDAAPWREARRHLSEVWYLAPPEALRLERLVARHRAHGKDEAAALAWSLGSDQANAELIAATAVRADLVVRVVE